MLGFTFHIAIVTRSKRATQLISGTIALLLVVFEFVFPFSVSLAQGFTFTIQGKLEHVDVCHGTGYILVLSSTNTVYSLGLVGLPLGLDVSPYMGKHVTIQNAHIFSEGTQCTIKYGEVQVIGFSRASDLVPFPPSPEGYDWFDKDEYESMHQQLVESIDEWNESLSFQSWLQNRAIGIGRDELMKKIGDKAVQNGFGGYLKEIIATMHRFLFGTRDDVIRNKALYEGRLSTIEERWNIEQFRNGDYVLLPLKYRDLPVSEFPLWWEFWDMGN